MFSFQLNDCRPDKLLHQITQYFLIIHVILPVVNTNNQILRMKSMLLITLVFVSFCCIFTSCESLGLCKICREVTYIDGTVTGEGQEAQYCDASLVAIEATPDYVDGNMRITWECR
jgi:hypothetical protein